VTKLSPQLIRAIASTRLHAWAYSDNDHLTPHGVAVYIDRRTDAGDGRRYAVHIDSKNPYTLEEGRKIVQEHIDRFARTLHTAMVSEVEFCRTVMDADDTVLAWLLANKFVSDEHGVEP